MRRKAIIGGLISLVFLYLALRKVEFAELWDVLQGVRWVYLIPNLLMAVGMGMTMRAWRWKRIIRPIGRIGFYPGFAATMIGFMANNVLPARLGEIARAVSLGHMTKLSRSAIFATIIVERIYDSFTLLLILWLVFSFSRISELTEVERIRDVGWVFLVINAALVVILVILQVRNEAAVRWVMRFSKMFSARIQKLAGEITEKFARGLTVHHDASTTVSVIVSSILLWFVLGVSNYFIFLSLGFDHLPLEASFVLLVVVSLLISVPSSPGYVGVFHYGVVISLGIYGLNESEAMAVAILLHGAQYIPITLMGFYYLRREHLRLHPSGEAAPTGQAREEADAVPMDDGRATSDSVT